MTFSGKLRTALILVAILPPLILTGIVYLAAEKQIVRIESDQAYKKYEQFSNFLSAFENDIKQLLTSIAKNSDFEITELRLAQGKRVGRSYRLPMTNLNFVEYLNKSGTILLSANRPALIGSSVLPHLLSQFRNDQPACFYQYESDFQGEHPSVKIVIPTDSGYLVGGRFLDDNFHATAQAIANATISYRKITRKDRNGPVLIGTPYLRGERLEMVVISASMAEFVAIALFNPSGLGDLFSNFYLAVIAVGAMMLLLALSIGIYFSSRTRTKILTLTNGAARVAAGDFSQPVIINGEDEFSELADSFNRMMKELTESRERLVVSEKIAAWQAVGRKLAHEVKNPLTPIAIATDDLRRSYQENLAEFPAILDTACKTIKGEVGRLTRLIDQFADFAKMPPAQFVDVVLDDFLGQLAGLYPEEISSQKIIIECDYPGSVRFDPDQMRQLFLNLIKNSFEATASNILIKLMAEQTNLVITIIDNGPGFPTTILDDGIIPYFSTKPTGSGLGLMVCQRIIFDHEGTMKLSNSKTGRAQVTITLPQTDA